MRCNRGILLFVEMGGWTEDKNRTRIGELKFFPLHPELGFCFRLFAGGDLFAKAAGVFAVKRSLDRLIPRGRSEVLSKHAGPGDRL